MGSSGTVVAAAVMSPERQREVTGGVLHSYRRSPPQLLGP